MELFQTIGVVSADSVPLIMLGLFAATFVSEDAACLAAGTLAASGMLSFPLAVLACFLGILVGDVALYWIGRKFGPPVLASRFFRRALSPATVERASAWLSERGASAVFLSRFVTGTRLPTYLLAGALRASFSKFLFYFVIAAAIWTPALVGAAAFAGSMFFTGNTVVGLLALFVAVRLAIALSTYNGRRLFVGRIRRIMNWEFWPLPVFYLPVAVYIAVLGTRFRGLTLFTAANPAIDAGGFKGESKDDIYRGLSASDAARPFLLQHIKVAGGFPSEHRTETALAFAGALESSFPLAVKPDAGERGSGVRIVRSAEQLTSAIAGTDTDLIIQEYAGGIEASIFYYRRPGETAGEIFSITEKRFPVITGDGRSTIERLILADPRAVCLAPKYFDHDPGRLNSIPAEGQQITLIDIGTHSRGAIFLDGDWLRTPELEAAIDRICRGYYGFYFGRFDVKAASFADLAAGRFKIIELNGVTSESTNIYDPRYSLFDAYRILFRQWQIAFEIGDANRKLGFAPATLRELFVRAVGRKPTVESRRKPICA